MPPANLICVILQFGSPFPGDASFESSGQLKLATPALSHTPHTCQRWTNPQQMHFSR